MWRLLLASAAPAHEPLATAVLLLMLGVLLSASALLSRLFSRLGVPLALLFLLVGMLGGVESAGGLAFDDYALAVRLGSVALILILFDGGLNTPIHAIRQAFFPSTLLATVGVAITAGLAALAARMLGLPWTQSLLLGAVVSPTDAAAIFSVLRGGGVQLKSKIGHIVEVESCFNDPMAVILTTGMIDLASGGNVHGAMWGLALRVPIELLIGAVVGVIVGLAMRVVLRWARLTATALYPALTLAAAFVAFGAATLMHGSGFLAVYVAAVVVGDISSLPYRSGLVRVHNALAWLSQIAMFLMLGLLVNPSHLPPIVWEGTALGLILGLVARPLAVWACLAPFRIPLLETAFVGLVGLRGAVPIILAAFVVLAGVAGAERVFDLVFFIVVVNTLIPGAFIRRAARWLGADAPERPTPAAVLEINAPHQFDGELQSYFIHPSLVVAGATLSEIPLPDDANVMLVVRGRQLLAGRGDTKLEVGDHVYVFFRPAERALIELLFGRAEEMG